MELLRKGQAGFINASELLVNVNWGERKWQLIAGWDDENGMNSEK